MKNVEYLIVGGGMAAASALKGIRELDLEASIAVVGAEADPPYDRPPLSKSLWKGKPLDAIWMETFGAEIIPGHSITELRPGDHAALVDDGEVIEYGKLLLATGGIPRRLPADDGSVIYFRNLSDYRALRILCETAERFLVVGGGFIASEIAAALLMNGKQAVMVFPAAGIGSRVLPDELSLGVNDFYRSKDVELFPGEEVVSIGNKGGKKVARLVSGREIEADAVVAGLGILPNVDLALAAGLQIEDGVVVGPDLRTSESDIFAAGDIASYSCSALDRRIRVEHEDNALAMGYAAGRIMAGASETYDRLPYFYSDLFEFGYEALGELDPKGETFIDWKNPNQKCVVYYFGQGQSLTDRRRVRGILLWNVHKRADAARELITSGDVFLMDELKGRL